jgi:hypothetical protein
VIGAGFGRTGTDSMREALTILGLGPCHHMFEVNAHEEQKRLWRAFVRGEPVAWDDLLAGYASCVDWPTAHYWRELAALHPHAKVVLTYRNAQDWWSSFEKTLLPAIQSSTDPESLGIALVRDRVFGGRPQDRDHAIAVYERNVRAVMEEIAPDRRLVHQPEDGWAPLCAFLGRPVPSQPYPSRNSSAAFRAAVSARGPASR